MDKRVTQQTLKKQKTAGLYSIGGWVGSIQVLARLPLIRLGQRKKTKNKTRYANTWLLNVAQWRCTAA
jgi:hypothetical protein